MRKFLILFVTATILLSGCIGQQKTAKTGDNVSVDYIGSLKDTGKIFDTSIQSVAEANNLSMPGRQYKPLNFTIGKGMIEGFSEGVIGMKVGQNKKIEVSPEKGYPVNPDLIQSYPIIQELPTTRNIPKDVEITIPQFERSFGSISNHTVGENLKIPDSNFNLTIKKLTPNVSLTYNLKVGYVISQTGAPWNETVVKIDSKNITIQPIVKKNEIIQFQDVPWKTTVIDLSADTITLRHNAIPETTIDMPNMFGQMVPTKISFNETSIIMDQNSELAGKTLIFNVTLRSIYK
jgi:FKBP-type peptidyl-prolyl cis-trans isomerase 2